MSAFISFSANVLYGQDAFIQMHLSSTELTMENGGIESITIRVENRTTQPFSGRLVVNGSNGISVISKESQSLSLEAGSSKYISTQILVEKSAKAGKKHIIFQLEDTQKNHITSQKVLVSLLPIKSMRTEILNTVSLLPAMGNILDIPIRIINSGNIDQTVRLIASFRSGTNEGSNNSHTLFVPSHTDTIISITKKITRFVSQQGELKVNIIGVYSNGDFFSSQSLLLHNPKSHVRFNLDTRSIGSNQNQISVGVINFGSLSEAYYLRGNIDFQQGKTKGGIQLDMVNWPNGLSVQNTWIELEHNKIGARVGNITKYGDQSLYGRGAEVFFNDTASGYSFAAGYIEKGYDLLNVNGFNLGNAIWISADRSLKNGSISTIITKDKDLYSGSDNKTIINVASLRLKDDVNSEFKFGLGHSQNIQDPSNSHPSILIEGSIAAKLSKNILINSNNSYASSYFPGNKRGSINIGQRINWNLANTTLWAAYRYFNFAPKYILSTSFLSYNNSNQYIGLGSSGTIGSFNYSGGPYYTQEKGSWNWMAPNDIRNLYGLGLNGTISWTPLSSKQYFNLQVDGGQSWMDQNGETGLQLRGTLNWTYGHFRIMSSAQTGSFYLYEAYRNQRSEKRTRYQVSPNYSQSFFRNKLRIEAGIMYIQDRETTNLLYTGNINYGFKGTDFFAKAQFSRYGESNFYRNFQVGITQKLPSFSRISSEKPGNIDLLVFNDKNGNGTLDVEETIAANHLIYINNKPFLTDQEGRISYKKLPKGPYRIDAPVQNGWFTSGTYINLDAKQSVSLEIPLQESGIVKGHIEYIEGNKLLEFSVNKVMGNVRIVAVNENGAAIETRTDDKGRFILFLPPGKHVLSVIGLSENIECINDKQVINASVDHLVDGVVFSLRVKEQKVEIKRFSSK